MTTVPLLSSKSYRGIVSHDIVSSWEKICLVAVAVLELVGAGIVAELTGGAISGDSTAEHLGPCWSVGR